MKLSTWCQDAPRKKSCSTWRKNPICFSHLCAYFPNCLSYWRPRTPSHFASHNKHVSWLLTMDATPSTWIWALDVTKKWHPQDLGGPIFFCLFISEVWIDWCWGQSLSTSVMQDEVKSSVWPDRQFGHIGKPKNQKWKQHQFWGLSNAQSSRQFQGSVFRHQIQIEKHNITKFSFNRGYSHDCLFSRQSSVFSQ